MHFHAWKSGLKTGQYYFRSRPARDAIKFTVNVDMLLQAADSGNAAQVMECLNSDNAAAKANLAKRRAVGQKPSSLSSTNMKKPVAPAPGQKLAETEKEKAPAQVSAAAAQQAAENEDSSDVDLGCLACGS